MKSLITVAITVFSLSIFANTSSPYAGQEQRAIKSLSQYEISGYLNGKGLGYAKAAELNQFPGPKHVLELASELKLSDEQIDQTQVIFDVMKTKATTLGKQFVEKEHKLNAFFANSAIDSAKLEILVADLGALEAQIRFVHLDAHLKQKALLSAEQIERYDQLRGYNSQTPHQHHHKH